jgi:endonuclease I
MKKKIFGSLAIVAIVVTVAFNVNLSTKKSNTTSLLALANVEALADTETDDEFTSSTGCKAVWENVNCSGKNGVTYSYAKKA